MATPESFARRLRAREQLAGYWMACDNPVAVERIARLGYDYIGVDGQHGVLSQPGWSAAMLAVDAGQRAAGLIRVPSVDPVAIGAALDTGARGVIVPMVESPEQAEIAVRATRHWPAGTRSLAGPVRAQFRLGDVPAEIDEGVVCIVMIETMAAMSNLEKICATPGLDAVYLGPADLSVALGGRYFGDPAVQPALLEAATAIAEAARHAGIAGGIHCLDGESAARWLTGGYTFATISSDITHLEQAAAAHLAAARGAGAS
ncbi:HpcH/HpaI aldolase family protein [Streptomyces sp. NPDC001222]|uniref:HpcH/HpaI aldolase family protein n=1 Tax=Streptomyces sp. NPDC001222 TaxID=3364548 RepID=UPI0036C6D2BB